MRILILAVLLVLLKPPLVGVVVEKVYWDGLDVELNGVLRLLDVVSESKLVLQVKQRKLVCNKVFVMA